jgi:hypothetical protein
VEHFVNKMCMNTLKIYDPSAMECSKVETGEIHWLIIDYYSWLGSLNINETKLALRQNLINVCWMRKWETHSLWSHKRHRNTNKQLKSNVKWPLGGWGKVPLHLIGYLIDANWLLGKPSDMVFLLQFISSQLF